MTVEQKRGNSICEEEEDSNDRFPVGMRVLAVDDDPTCLRVLDTLLRKCQYQVTTTNQAITALKMLRENKNKFDLVISDVRMPDMDGFKLLELVGLEMDLPVIMLSSYGDTELVMQGISHGACDYLLKPVRIEELKNIWQHVLRKKKFKTKDPKESHVQGKSLDEVGVEAQDPSLSDDFDQNRKISRKRKDQDDYEYEDAEDEENESEDTANQKKARVVWSVELHQKFVAAVNQLGLDKAVPKKILDLMDVEGLTRENVASHLQKYRLYLKRISNVASQQANLAAALGKDSSYLRMASLEGYRDYRQMAGPGRLSNTALSSYFPNGMLGRLNMAVGLNQTSSNPITTFGKLQPTATFPSIQNSNLFQGIPMGIGQMQQNKGASSIIGDFSTTLSEAPPFGVSSTSFQNSRTKIGNSNPILNTLSNNSLMLQGNTGGFGIQSSASLNQDSFKLDQIGSSNIFDHNRYNESFGNQSSVSLNPGANTASSSSFVDHCRSNENWTNTAQFSKFSSNSLPFNHDSLPSNSLNEKIFPSGSKIQQNPIVFPSNGAISAPMDDSRAEMQNQAGLIDNVAQNQNFNSKQRWENGSNHSFSNLDSRQTDFSTVGQINGSGSLAQHEGLNGSAMNTKATGGFLDQFQPHGDFAQTGFDPLDDLMSLMVKREHHETMSMEGEYGFDGYSLGSCI